jgi:hypothetical protein
MDLIERFKDRWDWYTLSGTESMPWSIDLIERFKDRWDWDYLSKSRSLPWSIPLIERFEDRWNWGPQHSFREGLSGHAGIPWSVALIERFEDRWNWNTLSGNKSMPWSMDLIERFKDRWDWYTLSGTESMPWSIDLIERFKDRWNWNALSTIVTIPWSFKFFECFEDRLDWSRPSKDIELPWSIDLIERFKDRWSWDTVSGIETMPWSIDLIERFKDRWSWSTLSRTETMPWSIDLIERFEDRWDWRGLSGLESLPWSAELIERYKHRWKWNVSWSPEDLVIEFDGMDEHFVSNLSDVEPGLDCNKSLPWSPELIDRFADFWDWNSLSDSSVLPWSIDLIMRFADRWDWKGCPGEEKVARKGLGAYDDGIYDDDIEPGYRPDDRRIVGGRPGINGNTSLPWSIELITCFEDRWNWTWLSRNGSLRWSLDLIERFEDLWDWDALAKNYCIPWNFNDLPSCGDQLYEEYRDYFQEEIASDEDNQISVDSIEGFEKKYLTGWNSHQFDSLSSKLDFPWSIDLIQRFEHRWNWKALSRNEALPWSIDLIERFQDRWGWHELCNNKALLFPTLHAADAVEIMIHHSVTLLRERSEDLSRSNRSARGYRAGELPAPITLDAEALNRYAALKAWRAGVAKEHNMPTYVIFHDATLAAIAQRAPQSLADLRGISGIGARKLEAYAAQVLRVIG